MARTALTVEDGLAAGLNATYNAAHADGNMFDNNGHVIFHVKNENAAALAVTVQTPFQQDGLDLAEGGGSVPASEERFFGPFSPQSYNQKSGTDIGKVYIDTDIQASVTIAVIKV